MALRPVALALVVLFLAVLSAAAAQTSPSEILANPEKYDGHDVTLTGTVTNLRETVSRKGNPYHTFDLSDGRLRSASSPSGRLRATSARR